MNQFVFYQKGLRVVSMPILELENVSYHYNGTKKNVINQASISFERGQVYAIIGRSGSGKTTLLSLLAGLDVCSEGSLTFQQTALKDVDRDAYRARDIGVIFQNYNLLYTSTAVGNIVLSMNISNMDVKDKKAHAHTLLDQVGIPMEDRNRKILKLSGGEQQRVAIARALSHEPSIILADEPSGNLDQDSEEQIMTILREQAHEQDRCVIVVTHSRKAASYADEVWSMNKNGELLFMKER